MSKLDPVRCVVCAVRTDQTAAGIASHVLPANSRPFSFFRRLLPSAPQPPHCLKKNAAPRCSHCSLMDSTHSGFIGLAFGPDSPPTITQWIPLRSSWPTSSSNGSTDKNRMLALTFLRSSIRGRPCCRFSTETPNQTLSGTTRPRDVKYLSILGDRLVNI